MILWEKQKYPQYACGLFPWPHLDIYSSVRVWNILSYGTSWILWLYNSLEQEMSDLGDLGSLQNSFRVRIILRVTTHVLSLEVFLYEIVLLFFILLFYSIFRLCMISWRLHQIFLVTVQSYWIYIHLRIHCHDNKSYITFACTYIPHLPTLPQVQDAFILFLHIAWLAVCEI